MKVVFALWIDSMDLNTNEVFRMVEWLLSLDEDFGLTLEAVFKSKSTTLLLTAPLGVWARLRGHEGMTFIQEVRGSNYLPSMRQDLQKPLQQRP